MSNPSEFAAHAFVSGIVGFEAIFKDLPITSTPMHIEPERIGFTYAQDELIAGLGDDARSALVHHGDFEPVGEATFIPMMTERLFVFADESRADVSPTPAQLGDVLAGRLTDWAQLGGAPGAIRLVGHGRPVHLRSFMALVRRALGVERLSSAATLKATYDEVAQAARSSRDSLAFGLRWSHVAATPLRPLTLLGAAPLPGLPLTLVLRRDLMADPDRRADVSRYLDAVRARLQADAAGFARLSETSHKRAA